MDPDRTELPWRSGNTHGFCVTGGLSPIASEPTPSPRLWATPPGATPAGLCEHTMRADRRLSIPELSTLAGIGTFYFGPTSFRAGAWPPARPRLAGTRRRPLAYVWIDAFLQPVREPGQGHRRLLPPVRRGAAPGSP